MRNPLPNATFSLIFSENFAQPKIFASPRDPIEGKNFFN